LIDPSKEALDHGFGRLQAVIAFVLAAQMLRADLLFDRVERADEIERLGRRLRLGLLRFKEGSPGVRPTLCVLDAGLLGVVGIRAIAVGQ